MIRRRDILLTAGAVAISACARAGYAAAKRFDLSDLQRRLGPGGRLGVAAKDLSGGALLTFQADQRFAFCSTFKLFLAAAILWEVERRRLRLDRSIRYSAADIRANSPVTQAHLDQGHLNVERLCAAIVEVSDNTAANLLLREIGGPAGLTSFMQGLGDRESRLDRYELELNQNLPGDPRDTTTPRAILGTMQTVLTGNMLSPVSRTRLITWMVNAGTGLDRLRGGLPPGWRVGDKTGTGRNGANNDLAITFPPGRPPILIASFTSGGGADNSVRNTVHAEVARRAAAHFA